MKSPGDSDAAPLTKTQLQVRLLQPEILDFIFYPETDMGIMGVFIIADPVVAQTIGCIWAAVPPDVHLPTSQLIIDLAAEELRFSAYFDTALQEDPELLALLPGGYRRFLVQVAIRLDRAYLDMLIRETRAVYQFLVAFVDPEGETVFSAYTPPPTFDLQ